MIVIGMISGTSADGIDAAAVELRADGPTLELTVLGTRTVPYDETLAGLLQRVLDGEAVGAGAICQLDTRIGQAFGAVAAAVDTELCGGRADLVASHGQTVHHWVEDGVCLGTLQLGQPAWIAAATGRPVVDDLRAADIAAGGHGAPLAPLLDRLLLAEEPGRSAALNLGGIANITVIDGGDVVAAFDTGPANILIDAAAMLVLDAPHDVDGATAARGQVHDDLLRDLLRDPHYTRTGPKSTGREHFNTAYLRTHLERAGLWRDGAPTLTAPDLLATVTELTAVTVTGALASARVHRVLASGGGTANPTLMGRLAARIDAPITTTEDLGVSSDAKEAVLFAVLGFCSVRGQAGAEPAATGARRAEVLGSLTPPHARFDGSGGPVPERLVVRSVGEA